MSTLSLPVTLVANTNENVNDLNSNLNAIVSWANGSVDFNNLANAGVTPDKLSTTLAQYLGITNAANTGRGKAIIATTESRTNVAFGTMTTADQVTGIVLPTDGLICVLYQATWQESVSAAASAGIFVGATQAKRAVADNVAPQASIPVLGSVATDTPLVTMPNGLTSFPMTAGAYTGDVTTGQIAGYSSEANLDYPTLSAAGPCYIFAAAGTYTISIQFKSSSGSVTAKNRKLWVWTMGF